MQNIHSNLTISSKFLTKRLVKVRGKSQQKVFLVAWPLRPYLPPPQSTFFKGDFLERKKSNFFLVAGPLKKGTFLRLPFKNRHSSDEPSTQGIQTRIYIHRLWHSHVCFVVVPLFPIATHNGRDELGSTILSNIAVYKDNITFFYP